MKCERCEGVTREELLLVSGETIKKRVSAWHCLDCGRMEYRATLPNRFIIEEADHPIVHRAA
jgi:hypothetical protein